MVAAARKVVLTDRALKALKPAPAGKRYIVWDAAQPHLGVRVTDKAAKSFIVVRRRPGQRNADTANLGRYPVVTLKDARDLAPSVLSTIAAGKSPTEVEQERQRNEAKRRRDTFAKALGDFLEDDALKALRSSRETEAILRREFAGQVARRLKRKPEPDGKPEVEWVTEWNDGPDPIWGKLPLAKIARRDVVERLDEIKRRGGKHAARHALSAIRKFFNWAADGERFGIETSPVVRINDRTLGFSKDGRELKRKRVLNDTELHDLWQAAEGRGYPFGRVVQMLMLTGQRLTDIAHAQWSEIDLNKAMLTVPAERYKTGITQDVFLPPLAITILRSLPRFGRGYIFTTTGGARPVSGFSKMKTKIDEKITKLRKDDHRESMPAWVLHDLRRTVRTRLVSDLAIEAFIAERVIGHALPGLHSVYDQGTHSEQKRAALEAWATKLADIVGYQPAAAKNTTVVPVAEVERRRHKRRP